MKNKWQLQDAKNKFCRVAEQAIEYGPQIVTKRGRDAIVILSVEEYEQLKKRKDTLVEFLKNSPMRGVDLELSRSTETGRKVNL